MVVYPYANLLAFLTCIVFAQTEHSGAYSSPQYAKKLYPKVDMNSLLPREKSPMPFVKRQMNSVEVPLDGPVIESFDSSIDRFDDNDTMEYGRSSFMESAGDLLNGAGGHLMSHMAQDLLARSTGSSQVGFDCIVQVLSLNLTNLVILVVLKALILAAGFFGAGAWKGGHQYGRSFDDNKNTTFITEDEMLLFMSYLHAHLTQDYSCLFQLACKKPELVGLYSAGADILLQGSKIMQWNSVELEQYEEISRGIKEASAWGSDGNPCDARYHCAQTVDL